MAFIQTILWDLANLVKNYHGNVVHQRTIAVRRILKGTSAVLLQSGLDEKWWSDSTECYRYLRNVQDLLAAGKNIVGKAI